MQGPAAQARGLPGSTMRCCQSTYEGHSEGCLRLRRPAVGATSSQRTLLLRQGPLRGQRYIARSQSGSLLCGSNGKHSDWSRYRRMLRRDVAVGARSIAGQVGVAAVEEIVEAQHAELMSFASLRDI